MLYFLIKQNLSLKLIVIFCAFQAQKDKVSGIFKSWF